MKLGAAKVLRGLRSAAVLLLASVAAGAKPVDDGRLELPRGERAADSLEWLVQFDSGAVLLALVAVHNLGPGDGRSSVIGYLLEPSGDSWRFSRSERPGHWSLSPDGSRMDLHQIRVQRSGALRRLKVRKHDLRLELEVAAQGSPERLGPEQPSDCSATLLESGAPATASFQAAGQEQPRALRGRATLVHRRLRRAESRCIRRRLELFLQEPKLYLNLSHATAADGGHRDAWLLRHGESASAPGGTPLVQVRWREGPAGAPQPVSLHAHQAGWTLEAQSRDRPLPIDLFAGMSRLRRALLRLRGQPSISLARFSYRLRLPEGTGARRQWTGTAWVLTTYPGPWK